VGAIPAVVPAAAVIQAAGATPAAAVIRAAGVTPVAVAILAAGVIPAVTVRVLFCPRFRPVLVPSHPILELAQPVPQEHIN